MDGSSSKYHEPERNTFLSRVFGPHSTEGNSMGNTEMTQIQASEQSFVQSGGMRMIESDQGSSSDDDASFEREEDDSRVRAFHGIQSVVLDADSDAGSSSGAGSIASVQKLGQGADSDSEYQERRPGAEEDNNDEDSPLFRQNLKSLDFKSPSPVPAGPSVGFGPEVSDRRAFKSKFIDKHTQFLKLGKDEAEAESFLFRKNSAWDEENQQPKAQTNVPRIFGNFAAIGNTPAARLHTLSPRERALWKWANVENLDIFLQEVYNYYLGNGFYCICIEKALNIATLLFVVFISTFMGCCIDYSKLPHSTKISEVYVHKCYSTQISGTTKVLLWGFYIFVALKVAQFYFDVRALRDIHNFYSFLLNISDKELQTVSWQKVIKQIMLLKDQNAVTANVAEVKAKNRIDAHDVANRIMRRENYLIALFNNDILDLTLPIPLYRTSTLTKTLEWNLNLCIIGFAFNESGYLKQSFLKSSQRSYLEEELRKRFMLAGFLNIILSPFLVAYFILLYFFRYFNEYKTSPSALSSRQYTPIAEWKFREYNELYHLFQKRLGLSVEVANNYIDQFPKEKTNIIMKFIAFVSGSFVAILALLTVFDPENFLNFEITKDKSVLFYISVFGTVWAICKNSVSGQYRVFDPEESLREVVSYLHYKPKEWEGKYHTEDVKQDFCKLFNLRVILLLRELASLVMTPFILWFSLPKSSGKIVDFMREVSVYVDGLGYVCKYATFEVQGRHHDAKSRASRIIKNHQNFDAPQGYDESEHSSASDSEDDDKSVNKMMRSYMYFLDSYQNNDNEVGKHQLPKSGRNGKGPGNVDWLNTNYSWKRQFQPGQRPGDFQGNNVGYSSSMPTGTKDPVTKRSSEFKADSRSTGRGQTRFDSSLGESFINSVPLGEYRHLDRAEEVPGGNGVLGLLNQYYKKSDVGR
ncbi:autophagy protein ATG9 [Lachancea thermotolerans CBS 6340]|uniref:Autophagy-related protein 9 n=1 Tax=Lachancea thermotolerans (strain ATCC 56472 / CBS 6340 / NRRL Y-8284) TaxID=559295 RepID=C5E232_LACTC|nr:KLTH0H01760p [Lachancea thermotolerans CBS 6340]CAR30093.1 KLTH0H01760p [Lachancea thermotolerans CBS 6340]